MRVCAIKSKPGKPSWCRSHFLTRELHLDENHSNPELICAFLRYFLFILAVHKFDVIKKDSFDAVCQVESLASHRGAL